jgi:hypothetical protein
LSRSTNPLTLSVCSFPLHYHFRCSFSLIGTIS